MMVPSPHRYESAADYHRDLHFQLLERVDGEISKRFKQESLEVPQTIEKLLLGSLAGDREPPSVPTKLQGLYHRDLNCQKLARHLQLLPELVQAAKQADDDQSPGFRLWWKLCRLSRRQTSCSLRLTSC